MSADPEWWPTEDQLELMRDKYVLWERSSRQGPMDSRDYNARCAEALKNLLSAYAGLQGFRSSVLREHATPESHVVRQDG